MRLHAATQVEELVPGRQIEAAGVKERLHLACTVQVGHHAERPQVGIVPAVVPFRVHHGLVEPCVLRRPVADDRAVARSDGPLRAVLVELHVLRGMVVRRDDVHPVVEWEEAVGTSADAVARRPEAHRPRGARGAEVPVGVGGVGRAVREEAPVVVAAVSAEVHLPLVRLNLVHVERGRAGNLAAVVVAGAAVDAEAAAGERRDGAGLNAVVAVAGGVSPDEAPVRLRLHAATQIHHAAGRARVG